MRDPRLPGGIMGKMLRVDLTRGTLTDEELTPEVALEWLGGSGLGAKILYDEVPPGVEWDDPENRLIIAVGPMGGTKVHGSGTYSAVTRGPMTNLAGTTQANGFFAAYLKMNGYDAIIFQGQAPSWQYLFIGPGGLELRDASHLLGMDCWEFDDHLHAELGYKERLLSVIGIGQAGEHLVRFAAISGDKGHVAAHNGVGAVMGSKRLKAIACARGKQQVPVARPADLPKLADQLFEHAFELRDRYLYRGGTAIGLSDMEKAGALPIKNYQTAVFPEHEQLNGITFRANFDGRHTPCWGCKMNHLHTGCMTSGQDAGYLGEEPEYEGFAAFGSQIMNTDQSSAFKLSNLADRYGVDLNEAGWLLGWVMECYEKGVFTKEQLGGLDLSWGNTKAVEALLRMIAYREGIGDLLAEGVMRASQRVGGEAADWAIYVKKGASPRGHDHRGRWTELLDTCTGNTSTIEATAGVDPVDGFPQIEPIRNRFDPLEVSTFVGQINGRRQFDDSLGVCRFDSQDLPLELACFNAITGLDYSPMDTLRMGRRVVHLLRAFNFRHGLTADLEEPSTRYASTPVDGAALGTKPAEAFAVMKRNYYRVMGWDDETGKPLAETLREYGQEALIADFWEQPASVGA